MVEPRPLADLPEDGVAARAAARRARAAAASTHRARDFALRADVSGVLARAVSMRAMLQGCAEALVQHLDAAFARIWTLRRGGDVLELQASAGAYTHTDGRYARVNVGELKIGRIALERRPYLTNAVPGDPRIEDKAWVARERMVAFAGFPLVVEERVVGVMALFACHALPGDTVESLGAIAAAVAQGVERKRSEDELRRSEAYLAEGQRLSHTGSWAWNLVTGERYWSREMRRIYGFPPDELPPPYEEVLARAHPADAPHVRRALEAAFRDGTELHLRTRIRIPGAPLKWVESYGHPVHDDTGRLVEFIGTVVDVTPRVRAARRLRRALQARYEAVLAERMRIARDMHDGLLQDVTGIALQLGALVPHVRTDPEAAAAQLRQIVELTERTGRAARRVLVGMRKHAPSADLAAAVREVAERSVERTTLRLAVRVSGRRRLVPPAVCDAAVAILHEALTNVHRHAQARTVHVAVAFRSDGVRLSVRDDGRGMAAPPTDAAADHFGLVGMRERAAEIGGALTWRAVPRGGTVVRLDVPFGA